MAYQPALSSPTSSASPYLGFTQQQLIDNPQPRPTTPLTPRSPFVPVRKHRSDTPPTQQVEHYAGSSGASVVSSSGLSTGGALRPSTKDNLLPLANSQLAQSPKPLKSALSPGLTRTAPSHSLASAAAGPSHSSPASNALPSSAPKIRARLTPAAAPRRKCLPGTEGADVPLRSPERPGLMAPPPLPLARAKQAAFQSPQAVAYNPQQYDSGASMSSAGTYGTASPIGLGFGAFPGGASGMNGLGAAMGAISLDHEPAARRAAGKDNVLVCVRVRPPAQKLAANADSPPDATAWHTNPHTGTLSLIHNPTPGGVSEYNFDAVVTSSDNLGVYNEAGRDLVLAAMEGFDAVIFAYGQTASGKTFTLSGNAANPGIIPQAVTEIFDYIKRHPEQEFLLRASYLEIYNETLKDLLAPESGPLRVRQDERKRFFVHPLREEVVTGEAQVAALLRRGEENRSTGRTDFNERSSRSHSVFQMTIESRDSSPDSPTAASFSPSKTPNAPRLTPGASGAVRMSRLSLIDLAGSEQATSQLERRSEGAFINKSLLTLEKVIASLTDTKKGGHVPYRDSKLTQILQPSLSGEARVAVVATVNPSPAAVGESQSTLKFATRVKKVVLKAVVNEVVDDKALIFKYRNHIATLEAQLRGVMAQASQPVTPSRSRESTANPEQERLKDQRVADLQRQLADLQSLFVTSTNVENRRQSLLPPRPVSPTKFRAPSAGSDSTVEGSAGSQDLAEQVLDLRDEVEALGEERKELLARIAELEARAEGAAGGEDESEVVARLRRENQELMVVAQNADGEAQLRAMERRYERKLDKCRKYEEDLEESLKAERKRVHQFERFILQHLASQADAIAGSRRRSSVAGAHAGGPSLLPHSASVAGFLPLMAESPDLAAISPEYVDVCAEVEDEWGRIEQLPFSEDGKRQVTRTRMSLMGRG